MESSQDIRARRPRATRFALQLPLRYRAVGEDTWDAGESTNISRTGMLFRAERLVPPRTVVEVTFPLPFALPGQAPANIICRCEVVRQRQGEPDSELGATITEYRFVRGPAAIEM